MSTQALTLNPFSNSFPQCRLRNPYFLPPSISLNDMPLSRGRNLGMRILASKEQTSSFNVEKKRKVVEHICLFKAKKGLSEEEEKDMLDYLYTSQYQMGGIVAISLGCISNENVENYTHAVFMRFQRKENVGKFYENPFYLRVLQEHVTPYCHGLINVDYETEVEDDILPIFRKGEEFNFGVEFVLLMAFVDSAFGVPVDDALASLEKLAAELPSLIVQSTQGSNFNHSSKEYTHGAVIRFRSSEAFEMFISSSEYKEMWNNKFQPIIRKALPIHFSVDPVGTEIM
ncbi:Stress responsive alpha-beta barrel domain protein [Melia azedarach]|uniref:Stress responsive alpha-beta barrel domain protein n=1 Tax=Melia azedarach TaxID=155640 RepID=A0ACC1Z346_MELAZ|nr:Stress responsive alpha-beta barrel domain protein [Melia azedarach]